MKVKIRYSIINLKENGVSKSIYSYGEIYDVLPMQDGFYKVIGSTLEINSGDCEVLPEPLPKKTNKLLKLIRKYI